MKFTIRDLLLVTMIVAILLAWWVDRRRAADEISKEREYRRTLEDIKWPVPGLEGYKRIWGEPNSSAPAPNPPKP